MKQSKLNGGDYSAELGTTANIVSGPLEIRGRCLKSRSFTKHHGSHTKGMLAIRGIRTRMA
ncbi:hypothetical protein HOLleu_41909 [Holothuria leucospilota]|uniref:Uncharacterized protein n=1 Tax=Holothuria leucospilota TaxID=206669 RepID=A0A9Q0YEL1_HOLLE|nr:hypothetical protein HOLleu_41909 [Holothuria leucospilota]